MKITDFLSFDLSFFKTTRGILLVVGCICLIIAIILIATGFKKKEKEEVKEEDSIQKEGEELVNKGENLDTKVENVNLNNVSSNVQPNNVVQPNNMENLKIEEPVKQEQPVVIAPAQSEVKVDKSEANLGETLPSQEQATPVMMEPAPQLNQGQATPNNLNLNMNQVQEPVIPQAPVVNRQVGESVDNTPNLGEQHIAYGGVDPTKGNQEAVDAMKREQVVAPIDLNQIEPPKEETNSPVSEVIPPIQ